MGAWLSSALICAQDLAYRRGQNASTAHLLAALYQTDPGVAAVCGRLGLKETALIAELVFVDERANGVDNAITRSQRLTVAMGMRRVLPMHLLHVLALEPQSASNRILLRLDMLPEELGQAALAALGTALAHPEPVVVEVPEVVEPRAVPRQNRLPTLAHEYQREQARANALWLGDEVEARLQNARPTGPARAPTTFADDVEARLRRRR